MASPVVAPEPQPEAGIRRSAVDRALAAGLGRFLGYVDLDAALDGKHHFVGWKVLELRGAPGAWDGVDLHVGDVVTRVNGFPIERDDQADHAFHSLAVASEIRLSILRDGKPAEVRISIVDDAVAPAGPTTASNAGEPAPSP